jgi:hypothetical protein
VQPDLLVDLLALRVRLELQEQLGLVPRELQVRKGQLDQQTLLQTPLNFKV